jgi:16S rRNA (adenine1518-N6/adenine1519-N6)-dimethyltransferase
VVEGDALQLNWKTLELPEGTLFVSNLPYQISSSLVVERSLEPAGVTRMVLMFQKEVAQRITAQAGTKEYGLLTVIAQTFWETSKVCDASPGDFFPPPNVASRVLQFRRRTIDWQGIGNAQRFLSFAKAAYSHRRKLLSRNLQGSWFNGNKEILAQLEELFAQNSLKPTARAEELDPKALVSLYLSVERAGLKPR